MKKYRERDRKHHIQLLRIPRTEDVDRYHKMEAKDLIEECIGYNWAFKFCSTGVTDIHLERLMRREIYEFRDKSVQVEFEKKLEELYSDPDYRSVSDDDALLEK